MLNKKVLLVTLIIVTLGLILLSFLSRAQIAETSFKTWEIVLSYTPQTQKLALKSFKSLFEEFRPDYRGAENSPYALFVKDKNQKVLYTTKIHIAEQLVYSIIPEYLLATETAALKEQEILTSIYIPYFKKGTKIEIQKNSSRVLEIKPS